MIDKIKKFFNEKRDNNKDKMKRVNFIDNLKMKKIEFKNRIFSKSEFSLKVKDISLVISAMVLVWVGYMNFSSSSDSSLEFAKSSNSIGDVELVSSTEALVENGEESKNNAASQDEDSSLQVSNENGKSESSGLVENDYKNEESSEKEDDDENEGDDEEKETNDDDENSSLNSASIENVSNSSSSEKYFAELRLERDNMYSKSLETYQQIVDSGISNDQKAIAIQEIEKINTIQNEIKIAEELIKLKDFEDVIIYKNDNSVSVIVRCAALSNTQVAQIQNIVSRELAVDVRKY
jgi:stage III sporulation protein AH